MSVEFHVYGLCTVYIGGDYLGYTSEQGVTVELDPKFLPVHTDAFGDQVPEDVQNMSEVATVTMELIKWDQDVLDTLQEFQTKHSDGNPVGALLKQCDQTFELALHRGDSPVGCEDTVEGPYTFGTAYLGPDSFNVGTRATRHKLTFHCLPDSSGVLFTDS